MDPIQETRTRNNRHRRDCQQRVNRSPLPASIKATLNLLLEHFGSASNYHLAWPSHTALAKTLGLSERTVRWNCKAILKAGLLSAEPMGLRDARTMLKQEYGFDFKAAYLHRLNFYRINSSHPFWTVNDSAERTAAVDKVLASIDEVLTTRSKTRTRPDREKKEHTLNPVAHDTLNPVAHDTLNPVAPFRQALVVDETSDDSFHSPSEFHQSIINLPKGEPYKKGHPLDGVDFDDDQTLSDIINDPLVKEIIRDVEVQIIHYNPNKFKSTSTDLVATASTVEFMFDSIKSVVNRYPTAAEIITGLNSKEFKGLKKHSWGFLCANAVDDDGNCYKRIIMLEAIVLELIKVQPTTTVLKRRNYLLESLIEKNKINPSAELEAMIKLEEMIAAESK